jgi:hypothetical protein
MLLDELLSGLFLRERIGSVEGFLVEVTSYGASEDRQLFL